MKFAKKIVAAIAVSAAFAAPAFADTVGMADLAITGFGVVTAVGDFPVTTGITITSESRTGIAGASFNGSPVAGILGSGTIGATVDVANQCSGPSCGALAGIYGGVVQNNQTTHLGTGMGNFAVGDMLVGGSAITTDGAAGFTRADSSVMSAGNAATANSTIANSVIATTTFTAGATFDAKFKLGYNAYLAAIVSPAAGASGTSLATISWSLTLQEVLGPNSFLDLLAWTPDQMNNGLTASNPGNSDTYTSIGTLFSNVVTLIGGHTYKLTINQASNSFAEEVRNVPEPGSMLLVALGLLALGAGSRRRVK